jgi:hypothetical protein
MSTTNLFSIFRDFNFTSATFNALLTIPRTDNIGTFPVEPAGSLVYETTSQDLFVSNGLTWSTVSTNLPPALQSIANLTTSGNEIIYTIASDTYATSGISAAGRSFLTQGSQLAQQTALGLVPGVNVQAQSSILDNLISIAGTGDQIAYTVGGNYSNTALSTFSRTNILNAANASTLRTNIELGYLPTGQAALGGDVVGTSDSQTLSNKTISGTANTIDLNGASLDGATFSNAGTPTNGNVLQIVGGNAQWTALAAGGDVTGPGANTLGRIATWTAIANDIDDANTVTLISNNFSGVNGITMTGDLDMSTSGNIIDVVNVNASGNVGTGTAMWTGSAIPVVRGGTGATSAASARTNLGLVIGTDVQAHDNGLDNLSGLATGANQVVTTTGVDTFGTTASGTSGLNLLSQGTIAAGNILYTSGANTFAATLIAAHARGALEESGGNEIVTETESQTLTNKTIDSSLNTVDLNGASFDGVTLSALSGAPGANRVLALNGAGINAAWRDPLGDVTGPGSATDNAVARYNASGKIIQNSGVLIDDSNNVTGINNIAGTLTTSSQPNVTSVGSLTGLTANGVINLNPISGSTTLSEGASVPSGKFITLVSNPVSGNDAANKNYVDSVAGSGLSPIPSVVYATATVLPNSPTYASPAETLTSTAGAGTALVIDGVTTVVGDNGSRVLIKNQADNRENGVYVITDYGGGASPWQLTRASDFNQASTPITANTFVFVENSGGTTNDGSQWVLDTTVNTIDPLTDAVIWDQFGGTAPIAAGDGLSFTGNTLNAGGSTTIISSGVTNDLKVNSSATANQVLLSAGAAGTEATYGALPLNDSNAVTNTLGVGNGGTGNTTFTSGELLTGNGGGALTTTAAPSGAIVGTTDIQTLSNKTLTSATLTTPSIADSDLSHNYNVVPGNLTADRNVNLPVLSANDTLVFEAQSQTLTNKTYDTTSNTFTLTDPIGASGGAPGDVLTIDGGGTTASWSAPAIGTTTVTSSSTITNNALVKGDGGARGVQQTGIIVDASNNMSGIGTIGSGAITSSGAVQGTSFTDTVATLSGGNLTSVTVGSGGGSATWDGTTIPINRGGTNSTSLTNGNVLVAGPTSVLTTKAAPSGDFVGTSDSQTLTNKILNGDRIVTSSTVFANTVGTSDTLTLNTSGISGGAKTMTFPNVSDTVTTNGATQTLTNKTMTSSTNNVVARGLFSNSGANTVSVFASGNPSSGDVLTATGVSSATWQAPTVYVSPDRTLFVYQSAADVSPNFSTLDGAITAASGLTPTKADPVMIVMYPGTYSVSNPLSVPQWVTITSLTNAQGASVTIRPTAPASVGAVLILPGNTRIMGIVVDGADGSGGHANIGILSNIGVAGVLDLLTSVTVRNCIDAGTRTVGNGARFSKILVCRDVSAQVTEVGFTMTTGHDVTDGGLIGGNDINASGFFVSGFSGTITNGFKVSDENSWADITDVLLNYCVNGLVVGAGTVTSQSQTEYPTVRISGAKISKISSVAIQMLQKCVIRSSDLKIEDDTGLYPSQLHLTIDNPSLPADPNFITALYANLRYDLISFSGATDNPARLEGADLSETPGEIQTRFGGEVSIGLPGANAELAVGGGDSHTQGMVLLRDDGGVFTDVTSEGNLNVVNPIATDIATTSSINLASAPATIDGIAPTIGVSRILVKDGSTANPGSESVDNGIWIWNGTGAAMTRASDFGVGLVFSDKTYFGVASGTVNGGCRYKLQTEGFPTPISDTITVGTSAFSLGDFCFHVFPASPANNDALYIGAVSLPLQFLGIKISVSLPIDVTGSLSSTDVVAWEYWNGGAWVTLPLMTTDSSAPYVSKANTSFSFDDAVLSPNSNNFQMRFGNIASSWGTTTVNGMLGYWVRARVTDAANITVVPRVVQIKLHTSRTEINSDGFVEFFGSARPIKQIPMVITGQSNAAGDPPDSQDQFVSDVLAVGRSQNEFNNGTNTEVLGFVTELPGDLDTSTPIKIRVRWSNRSGGGAVRWRLYYGYTTDSSIDTGTVSNVFFSTGSAPGTGPNQQDVQVVTNAAASSNKMNTTDFELDISEVVARRDSASGDVLWYSLNRMGTDGTDTNGGDANVIQITPYYRSWCEGFYEDF